MLRAPVSLRYRHQQHAEFAPRSPPLIARGHPHPRPKRHASTWGAQAAWSAELLPAVCPRQHRLHQHQKHKQQHGVTAISALPEWSAGRSVVKLQQGQLLQQRCRTLSPLASLPASAAAESLLALLPAAAFPATSLLPVSGPWGVWAVLVGAGAIGIWSERTRLGKELSGALVATLVGGRGLGGVKSLLSSHFFRVECTQPPCHPPFRLPTFPSPLSPPHPSMLSGGHADGQRGRTSPWGSGAGCGVQVHTSTRHTHAALLSQPPVNTVAIDGLHDSEIAGTAVPKTGWEI